MENNHFRGETSAWTAIFVITLTLLGGTDRHAAFAKGGDTDCDRALPEITTGYGADGPYTIDQRSIRNPSFRRKPVIVFLPQGAESKRPVIFFSHGYGPNRWETYSDLIHHLVSRGYILVYSTFPALFADHDKRYDALRSGFEAAVEHFDKRMDLSRVGFLGHSFGGGATPAMAYHGLVRNDWGKNGAFMMEMAPWYMFQMTPARWRQLPDNVLQVVQVYEKDEINDHRMAIDIYNNSPAIKKYFFLVRSTGIGDCNLIADHATPGRNRFLRQKQHGVFRPLDALADCVFTNSAAACNTLATIGQQNNSSGYHLLSVEAKPVPSKPESFYKFPWQSNENPRLQH